ncbi:MAG: hypothetical protein WC480_00585 [Patescibacteria group bacterium]
MREAGRGLFGRFFHPEARGGSDQAKAPEQGEASVYQNGQAELRFKEYHNQPETRALFTKMADHLAPFLDHPVKVWLDHNDSYNPGGNTPRRPDMQIDFDMVTINMDYWDGNELPDCFFHEVGHSLEDQLASIAHQDGKELLPSSGPGCQYQADLIACYILRPEEFQKYLDIPAVKDTYQAIEQLFSGNNFDELRKALVGLMVDYRHGVETRYQASLARLNIPDAPDNLARPAWLAEDYEFKPFNSRSFRAIEKVYREKQD